MPIACVLGYFPRSQSGAHFRAVLLMIAEFIGTIDQSLEIFRTLTFSDESKGLVIGLCVAFIGSITDRFLVEWSGRR